MIGATNAQIPAEKWTTSQVCEWLNSFGMTKYAETFLGNEVNGAVLLGSVDEEALIEELGVSSKMHRKTIILQIEKLKTQEIADVRNKEEKQKMQLKRQELELRKEEEEHKSLLRKQEEDYRMKLRREEEDEKLAREMERMDMKEQKHESKLVKDPRLVYKTETYDGAKYVGQFLGKKRHGYGVYEWNSGKWEGNKYEGHWVNGKAEGFGKYYHHNGDIYEGPWVNGIMEGFGKYYHHNGDIYEGKTLNSIYNSTYILILYSFCYLVPWVNDKAEGLGAKTFANGNKVEGTYVKGQLQGRVKQTFKDGSIKYGIWKDNEFVKWEK